jgi:hypothetical protein
METMSLVEDTLILTNYILKGIDLGRGEAVVSYKWQQASKDVYHGSMNGIQPNDLGGQR